MAFSSCPRKLEDKINSGKSLVGLVWLVVYTVMIMICFWRGAGPLLASLVIRGTFDGSSSMQMQQVRYFLALCQECNFTRAARRCAVTQPTLSIAIRQLETKLSSSLFQT